MTGQPDPVGYHGDRCTTCSAPLFGKSFYAPLCGPCGRAVAEIEAERAATRMHHPKKRRTA